MLFYNPTPTFFTSFSFFHFKYLNKKSLDSAREEEETEDVL